MAHVGQLYKLAFRRDFAVNRPNSRGYPEGISLAVGEFTTPVSPVNVTFFFRGINQHKDDDDGRTWDFDPLPMFGLVWSGSLVITGDPVKGNVTCRVDIFDNLHLLVFSGLYGTLSTNPYEYGTGTYNFRQIVFGSPFLIPNLNNNDVFFEALHWDLYP